MSTFEGLISEIEGVSIDQFEKENLKSRAYFLSHCHSDHMRGINSDCFIRRLCENKYKLYTSEVTAILLKNKYPNLEKYISPLSVEETNHITVPSNTCGEGNYIEVNLIPAGHCLGSVMFLFKTTDKKNILYTGDFRISSLDLKRIKQFKDEDGKTITIHKLYFDSTFWSEDYLDFPSREESCQYICDIVKEWISKGSQYIVNINFPSYYGFEFLYLDMWKKLKMPIHVSSKVINSYRQIAEMEEVFTSNSSNTQIHGCTEIYGVGIKSLKCRNMNEKLYIRHIRPSARKWLCLNKTKIYSEDYDDKYSICYSSHCSFNELKDFLTYLKPVSVEPCVDPSKQKNNSNNLYQQNEFHKTLQKFCNFSNALESLDMMALKTNKLQNCSEKSKICITYPETDSDDDVPRKKSCL